MKLRGAVIALFLAISFPLIAQTQAPQPSQNSPEAESPKTDPAKAVRTGKLVVLKREAESPNIDPAKEADIRKLLELTGAKELALQTMQNMEGSIRPLLTNSLPPGEYREQLITLFFEKFHTKVVGNDLLDLIIPIYDKHFSSQEIAGLIQFYRTPLGKKLAEAMPQLTDEAQQAGQKWGEDIGRSSMLEVLAEHPDLKKALEDAQRAMQPGFSMPSDLQK